MFPWGQQPNASPVFWNKASIQWGGDRLTLPSQQHLAPLQVQNILQDPGGGAWGGGVVVGLSFSVSATETSPGSPRRHLVFG